MPALANVALTNTFFEQMTRINQLVVKTNDMEYVSTNAFSTANMSSTNAAAAFLNSNNAFNKANAANSLAYNTGIGANAFASATIAGANTITIAAFDRANVINVVANLAFDKANSANLLAYNTGAGANAFLLATIAGANSAVGTGANSYAATVGSSANTFLLATLGGANTASAAAFNKANSANIIAVAAFNAANTGSSAAAAFDKANSANIVASAAFGGANLSAKLTGATFTDQIVANTSNITLGYGIVGGSTVNHAIFGKSSNTSFGGVVGYTTNDAIYGILGHQNLYSFYGSGIIHNLGEIRATSDITAYYSDERLKTVVGPITNPMDKLSQLTGLFYYQNEIAKSLGYNDTGLQIGVLAQDVKQVIPEAVCLAPFDTIDNEDGTKSSKSGENYLTVKYEKLIPLLIEAIKEQQREIDNLKKLMDSK